MFQISVRENVPAVGLGRVMSHAVGEKQCFWVAVTILVPVSQKLGLLHGLMWLHMLKNPIISK